MENLKKHIENRNNKLTEIAHDLFTDLKYRNWLNNVNSYPFGKWHSLIVELDKAGCEIETIKALGAECHSKLVFCCIEAPNFNRTGQITVIFNLAGSLWHSVIWHNQGKGNT